MLKIIYIKDPVIEHSITQITYKQINKYKSYVFNNYKINKAHNVKKTYYKYNNDVFINKHSTINTNDTHTITNNIDFYNVTDNNYYTKQFNNTGNITNNYTT